MRSSTYVTKLGIAMMEEVDELGSHHVGQPGWLA